MPEANTTRYALLGHLALRDWSAYELARSLRRTLHWFWPRAESVIYAEVKRLQKAGLASVREEPAADGSSRSRAIYSITAAGRRQLKRWLTTPPETIALEIEPLLRLHLARFGTKDDLLASLTALRETADQLLGDADAVAAEFVAGTHVLQDEAHVRGLLFDALFSLGSALDGASRRALEEVERWPDLDGTAAAKRRGIDTMRRALESRRAPTRKSPDDP